MGKAVAQSHLPFIFHPILASWLTTCMPLIQGFLAKWGATYTWDRCWIKFMSLLGFTLTSIEFPFLGSGVFCLCFCFETRSFIAQANPELILLFPSLKYWDYRHTLDSYWLRAGLGLPQRFLLALPCNLKEKLLPQIKTTSPNLYKVDLPQYWKPLHFLVHVCTGNEKRGQEPALGCVGTWMHVHKRFIAPAGKCLRGWGLGRLFQWLS